MPFGHGIGNPEDYPYKEFQMVRNFVRSGPGYTLSQNTLEDTLDAEVHNSSKTEPAVNTSFIVSTLPVAVGLVWQLFPNLLSDANWQLVMYLVALFAPIITALMIRGKVWSPASVKKVLDIAIFEAEKTRKQ